jgi:hypothetical protein
MTRVLFGLSIAVTLVLCSCKVSSDLNTPCVLKKKNPDGGTAPVPILESELRGKQTTSKDFISLTVDCDKSFCVRDSSLVTDAGPGDFAIGYCSAQCDLGVPGNCPSYDDSLDQTSSKLSCRALLLDVETLAQLAGGDAGTVGNIREPYFCARSPSDGGS